MALVNGQYQQTIFPVVQKLTDTGFETVGANTNFNGDYSVTPEDAFLQAPTGARILINALIIAITDSGTFSDTDYGNIVGGLTNGILTVVEFNGVEVTNPAQTINTNRELFGVDSDAQIAAYSANERTLVARFNFQSPLVLNGNTDDKFILRLNDDMTGLDLHEFLLYGEFE